LDEDTQKTLQTLIERSVTAFKTSDRTKDPIDFAEAQRIWGGSVLEARTLGVLSSDQDVGV
jgi:hypothetical protein